MLTSHVHLVVLVVFLVMLQQSIPTSAGQLNRIDDLYPSASALSLLQGHPGGAYQRRATLWSKLFRSKDEKMQLNPGQHELHVRNAVIHLIPYKKRTIPLELQKALYAHGIVGRRR